MHRKRWFCNSCQENYPSQTNFVNHLKLQHGDLSSPLQLGALANMYERPMDKDGLDQCPFCLKEGQLLRTHVPSHMSTLAFAALKRHQDILSWEGQGQGRRVTDKDSSMSSKSSAASDTSTASAGKSKDGWSMKPTSKTVSMRRQMGDSTQRKPSDRSKKFPVLLRHLEIVSLLLTERPLCARFGKL